MNNENEWAACRYTVQIGGSDPFIIIAKGRDRWALEALIQAGLKGITPITNPAPRVSPPRGRALPGVPARTAQ